MAVVTVAQVAQLAWICHRCKKAFSISGPEHDPRGANAAQAHEEDCKSDVRIGMPLPKIEMQIEPPVSRDQPT